MHDAVDYDTLTDLFLSDTGESPHGPAAPPGTALRTDPAPSKPAASKPALRLAKPIDSAHESNDTTAGDNDPPDGISVEGLILGHLPVLGAAWVTQYARHRAQQIGGPVGLLRCHEGQAWIDIVDEGGTRPRPAPTPAFIKDEEGEQGDAPERPIDRDAEPELMQAARAAASRARAWIIRVDDCLESDLVLMDRVGTITLLTGADDPAVIASYRTLKSLATLARSMGRNVGVSHHAEGLPLDLRVVVMGAPTEQARKADVKIRRSVRTFLQTDLAPAQSIERIGPCATTALYRGGASLSLDDLLAVIAPVAILPSPSDHGHAQHTHATESPIAESLPDTPHSPRTPATSSRARDALSALLNDVERAPSTPVQSQIQSQCQIQPTPEAARPVPVVCDAAPTDLIALLAGERDPQTPGLTDARIECPFAQGVRFATDDAGGLHAVAQVGEAGCDSEHAAVAALLAAQAWATSHAALLKRVLPGVHDPSRPTLHAVTPRAMHLRDLLQSPVRAHLLTSVGGVCGVVRVS